MRYSGNYTGVQILGILVTIWGCRYEVFWSVMRYSGNSRKRGQCSRITVMRMLFSNSWHTSLTVTWMLFLLHKGNLQQAEGILLKASHYYCSFSSITDTQ